MTATFLSNNGEAEGIPVSVPITFLPASPQYLMFEIA